MPIAEDSIRDAYRIAKSRYADVGVDTDAAMDRLSRIAVSMHCWQGDDVVGFEDNDAALGNGLAVTGNHPGRARTVDQLRTDLELAYRLIPGDHRLNLHAMYGEFGDAKVDRDEITPHHFAGWMQWSADHSVPLDFNPSFFSHRLAADGFTLASADDDTREFWIRHGIASREIAAAMGRHQGTASVNNFWIPDGYKDTPADRKAPRQRLADSLDKIFAEDLPPDQTIDAVECKLFGIGSESYVVGSHEFYMGYAISRRRWLCLDAGHFHPTEVVSDKISAVMPYVPGVLLHVSRGVRWDSDHVVTYDNELVALMQELVRGDYLGDVRIGLDFFDASINRVAAWVIGTRNVCRAMLAALLEPTETLVEAERDGDLTTRLALMEQSKTMPVGAVWDQYCLRSGVPVAMDWLPIVQDHHDTVASGRDRSHRGGPAVTA